MTFSSPAPSPLDGPSRNNSIGTVSTDDDDDMSIPPMSISRIFNDAALYTNAITHPERESISPASDREVADNFASLVGQDLDAPHKALATGLAQLSVRDWISANSISEEHEVEDDDEYTSDESVLDETISDSPQVRTESPEQDASSEHITVSSAVDDDKALSPTEIIDLLMEDFGELALDEKETLLSESDGALIQDVVILGVLHVTTHRLAFHASLLSSKPEVSPWDKVIKTGSAIIHRKGLHRKRRVWLELSQDFISAFPSSLESDRIRPWKSILLSSIKTVCPVDQHRPRTIDVLVRDRTDCTTASIEFDTEESALGWRRELLGALYIYRRRMQDALRKHDTEDTNSVRISIPLERILNHRIDHYSGASYILTLYVSCGEDSDTAGGPRCVSGKSLTEPQMIQFGVTNPEGAWANLSHLVNVSKRRKRASNTSTLSRNIVVDFGSLAFYGSSGPQPSESKERPHNRERAACEMLAIDYDDSVWMARVRIDQRLSSFGCFLVSSRYIGFWSKSLAFDDIVYRVHMSTIKSVRQFGPLIPGLPGYGIALEIEQHKDMRFKFCTEAVRNEALDRIHVALEAEHARIQLVTTPPPTPPAHRQSMRSPLRSPSAILSPLSRTLMHMSAKRIDPRVYMHIPKVINVPHDTLPGIPSKHMVCLTIGTRGDVQPYIALGLGLQREGHRVTIVTHAEYKPWIEGFGIGHRAAGGDPGALMKLSVENKMFSPQFFRESLGNYRTWLDHLLEDSWKQCHDAEVLLESPYAMGGVHIAEALNIPYFRVCTMPWTKTADFPHPFISPPVETPTFNTLTYILFDNVFWTATSSQINRWRRDMLHIEPTDMGHMAQSKIPFIYNFSPSVVPKPLDWGDTTIVSGYWFLDNPDHDWTPPESLLDFMHKARTDGKPIVYIGFGSIIVPDPDAVTRKIIQAVLRSDVRAIVSKGWSTRMSKKPAQSIVIPPECYMLDKVPHDWLFPLVDAALHHGGAGTTSASLRAGIPTLIKPWFGDQFFWASRVQRLGAGLKVPSLRTADLAHALTKATTDKAMREKAALVGERIRSEDGVRTAIQFIYTYLPRAGRDRATLD